MAFPFGLWHRTQRSVTSTGRKPEFVGEAVHRSRGAARALDARGRGRVARLDPDLVEEPRGGRKRDIEQEWKSRSIFAC